MLELALPDAAEGQHIAYGAAGVLPAAADRRLSSCRLTPRLRWTPCQAGCPATALPRTLFKGDWPQAMPPTVQNLDGAAFFHGLAVYLLSVAPQALELHGKVWALSATIPGHSAVQAAVASFWTLFASAWFTFFTAWLLFVLSCHHACVPCSPAAHSTTSGAGPPPILSASVVPPLHSGCLCSVPPALSRAGQARSRDGVVSWLGVDCSWHAWRVARAWNAWGSDFAWYTRGLALS